jgi:hypothetical protein
MTVKVMVAVPAVTVTFFAVSGAVSMTLTPFAAESVPTVVAHLVTPAE